MLSKNQITEIRSLHLKKYRELRRLFIAEGIKTVTEILATRPELVHSVFATAGFISNNIQLPGEVPVTTVSQDELKKISLQASPNEALAVCNYIPEQAPAFDPSKQFTFYLDDIRDPGNMGTIIRLADWYGLQRIFCSPESCEFYNPKVVQSAMGAFLRVSATYTALEDVIKTFHVANVYGAVLDGKNIYREKLMNGLIVIGNEANGIRLQNLELISHPVTIPAAGGSGTESLNAAMASAIIVSEFHRQLRQS
jgi:RNA methyltransferase, TrmH family